MSKMVVNLPAYDRSRSMASNHADWINSYWRLDVARAANNCVISRLVGGVPKESRRADYNHPDIIWVHKDGTRWNITRK